MQFTTIIAVALSAIAVSAAPTSANDNILAKRAPQCGTKNTANPDSCKKLLDTWADWAPKGPINVWSMCEQSESSIERFHCRVKSAGTDNLDCALTLATKNLGYGKITDRKVTPEEIKAVLDIAHSCPKTDSGRVSASSSLGDNKLCVVSRDNWTKCSA